MRVPVPKNAVGPNTSPKLPTRRPGRTETAPHGDPMLRGECAPTYPVVSTVTSSPMRLGAVSQPPDRAALHRPPPPSTVGGGGGREVTLRAGRPPPLVPVVLRGRRSRSAHP